MTPGQAIKETNTLLTLAGSLIVLIAALFGAYQFIDTTYMRCSTAEAAMKGFKKESRIESYIYRKELLEDSKLNVRWHLKKYPNDQDAKDRLEELNRRIQKLNEKIDKLQEEEGGGK